jgi:kinetochore protein Mis13/DSN1
LADEKNRLEEEEGRWKGLLSANQTAKPQENALLTETLSINGRLLSTSQQYLLALLDEPHSHPVQVPTPGTRDEKDRLQESSSTSASSTFTEQIASRISNMTTSLEPTIDLLADGVHHLQQFNQHATRVADKVKGVWAKRLEQREIEARKDAGAEDFGARDVLRALAGKMSE